MKFTGLITGLVNGMRALIATLLLIAIALNFANIIGRYLMNAPIASAEEVMLFLLVAVVFLGSSVVSWQAQQIRMDVFLHMLRPAARRRFEIFSDVATIVVSLALVWFAWPVINMLAEYDQRSQAANVPLFIPQVLIPIGLALTALLTAVRLIRDFRGHGADAHQHNPGGSS